VRKWSLLAHALLWCPHAHAEIPATVKEAVATLEDKVHERSINRAPLSDERVGMVINQLRPAHKLFNLKPS